VPENEIVPGKETVVQALDANWSFHLPHMHRVEIDHENSLVNISTPHDGSIYRLAGLEETDDEVIVKLGEEFAGHAVGTGDFVPAPGYRVPLIQDEFERLHGRWMNAGLPEQVFNAWAQGASRESHLHEIRRRLREAGAR